MSASIPFMTSMSSELRDGPFLALAIDTPGLAIERSCMGAVILDEGYGQGVV